MNAAPPEVTVKALPVNVSGVVTMAPAVVCLTVQNVVAGEVSAGVPIVRLPATIVPPLMLLDEFQVARVPAPPRSRAMPTPPAMAALVSLFMMIPFATAMPDERTPLAGMR